MAHAARNTDIPFMVLKHRVLAEGKPLAAAIAELKPELNEVEEANRALGRGARRPVATVELIWEGMA